MGDIVAHIKYLNASCSTHERGCQIVSVKASQPTQVLEKHPEGHSFLASCLHTFVNAIKLSELRKFIEHEKDALVCGFEAELPSPLFEQAAMLRSISSRKKVEWTL